MADVEMKDAPPAAAGASGKATSSTPKAASSSTDNKPRFEVKKVRHGLWFSTKLYP
jgi:hypothetical protein